MNLIRACIRRMMPLTLLLTAMGCGNTFSPSGLIELEATATSYRPGESISLRVENVGHATLLVGVCPTAIFPVLDPDALLYFTDPCPAMAMELGPGDESRIAGRLPADLPPGEYQIGFGYDSQIALSQVIEVLAAVSHSLSPNHCLQPTGRTGPLARQGRLTIRNALRRRLQLKRLH